MKTTDRVAVMVGLDVHRRFSTVTGRDAEGKIAWRQRLQHEDRRLFRQRLEDWPRGMPVILESSFGWEWMCEELEQAGLEPCLASSRKVAAWRNARGMAKSNRPDADLLSELGSQTDRWWQVCLPPREVRDRREWLRYRMSLVQLQTGLKNRIHAILHRHGILHDFADLFGVAGRRMLMRLANDTKKPRLRESARATLKGYLQLLDHLRRQIATVTRTIYRQLQATPEGKRLQGLPGVGAVLAHTILAEVGDFGRFWSSKHLASYSLLAPRAFDSGEETGEAPKGRHVGHMGRRTLKWAWIEAAHGAVRRGGRFRKVFEVLLPKSCRVEGMKSKWTPVFPRLDRSLRKFHLTLQEKHGVQPQYSTVLPMASNESNGAERQRRIADGPGEPGSGSSLPTAVPQVRAAWRIPFLDAQIRSR
jgi:transposase